MLVGIDQDKEGIVTTLDESRHGLEDGDYVTFSEIEGMTELNDAEPRKVTVKGLFHVYCLLRWRLLIQSSGPYTFSIGDTSGLSEYKKGGLWHQVKMPKIIKFVRQFADYMQGPSTDR